MHVFSILLFVISANLDNLAVAVAYGIKKIKIGVTSNLLIALVSAIGTLASMCLGKLALNFISTRISNIIGSSILIMLGLWFTAHFLFKRKCKEPSLENHNNEFCQCQSLLDNPEMADTDASNTIEPKESVSLAIALTLNNFGLGIGASITGLSIPFTSLATFAVSALMIPLGFFLGRTYLSKLFGKYAELISALLIIFMGLYELFN